MKSDLDEPCGGQRFPGCLAFEYASFAERYVGTDRQSSDEFRFLATLHLADLDRRGAGARLRPSSGVHREDSELVITALDQVQNGVLGVGHVVLVALGPDRASHLALLYHVPGDATTSVGDRRFPLQVDVVLADLDNLRRARRRGHVELALQLERRRRWTGFAETGRVLRAYPELVLVSAQQIVANVSRVLDQIIVRHSPLGVVGRVAELDLVALKKTIYFHFRDSRELSRVYSLPGRGIHRRISAGSTPGSRSRCPNR